MEFLLSTMAQKDNWQKYIHEVKVQIHLKGLIISTFLINCKKREEGEEKKEENEKGEKVRKKK